ncbi:TonB-dependent receptor [Hallella mizrahii]|uniref:TonB-dependent receptor n=1 Tax=Hallella mizrahii TaxID=2606637 RepID=A0A7K0KCM0_9BACT|nr:TonB-dependent receptor [Hallella mizrahii]MST83185.1 TonB-dependent receptor [Hallella mizrahii]
MDKHLLMMVALSCAATASWAADNEPVDSIRTYELQGVQVTSTRAGKKTPMAFSTLTQKQIKQVNFGQDIPYILSLTPSVTTTSDAGNGIGYTSIRVRGIDPSRINITANGVPVNDAESSQVYFVNMGDLASSVQSMQLQRGAGTSTNGAGAFGATLNMQTENIGTQPYIGLDASAGSYYSHKETLRFGTGLLHDHWGLQGRLSNIGSKGYLDRASTKLNSYFLQGGYFSDNTMVKLLTFNGTEQTYHAWNYASKYEQSLYGRRYNSCGEYYDDKGNVHYYKDQTDNYHQMNYQAIWNQLYGQNWSSNVTLHYTYGYGYYNEYKSNKDYRDYGLSDTKFKSDLTRKKLMENNLYGVVASINYDNKSNYKATLGGGWNKYIGDHWGEVLWTKDKVNTFYPGYEYYRNRAWKSDFNLYTKESWTFLPGLNAYIDLQYRHVGYRMQDPRDYYIDEDRTKGYWAHDDFDFFNPKFGINYQLDSHNRLYASYAISHKEPTRNDYQNNYVNHLKAEKLQDWELGYRYESPAFSAGVNLYYMYYNHQYVLTGELDEIGEMKASNDNSGKSYREGVELEAAWKPVDWFRWDANATLSRNICKDWTVTLKDGSAVSLGDTHTAFSPDFIFNNIFTFNYKGFNAGIQSQYIGKQYLTNTDFDSYKNYNKDGSFDRNVDMFLKAHFNTNVNLSYHFALPCFGLKDITLGVTLYNIFNAKYDNNGWAAPSFRKDSKGNVEAYCTNDLYEAGFAPSAPFNWMAHLSINF